LGDEMLNLLFKIIKKVIVASLLIYSFDVFTMSLGFNIPINFVTILLVSIFDFSALICLFLFSLIL